MEAVKGIHALATTFFVLLIAYVAYDFVTSFIDSTTDTTLLYVYWGSYILILIITALGVPAIIAFGENTDASLLSAVAGIGFYFAGVLFMRLFQPVMTIFVGDSVMTAVLSDQFSIQIMSFIYLLGILFSLFIGPIVIATMPEYVEAGTKKLQEAIA